MKYVCIGLVFLIACSPKMIPLKGNYPTPPISVTSDRPIDSVWSSLIDVVSQTGMSIKVIDKSSGLLVTEDYDFKGTVAYEKKDGTLSINPAALVTSKRKMASTYEYLFPDQIMGNWNIRLKSTGTGTAVTVNLTNIRAYDFYVVRGMTNKTQVSYDIRTTGVFENNLLEKLR